MLATQRSLLFALMALAWPLGAAVIDPAADLAAAREHLQKGRYAEALEAYGTLAESAAAGAERAQAAVGISRAHEAEGRWKDATDVIVAAVRDLPDEPLVHARLAELHFLQGRYAEAEQSAIRAIELDDKQPLARLVLADVYTETGRLKEANAAYRWFVRFYNAAQPADAETLLLVARGSAQYARFNSVSQIFSFVVNTLCPDALQDDPASWQAHFLSGSLLLEKYNRAQAMPELQQALAVNPRAADVIVAIGEAALQQNDLDQAAEQASRALAVNPHHPAALRLKADVLLKTGKLDDALEAIQQALAVNP
ncbi:MAG TPA: tetratricopeptide repeat protein, partial [Planctomycetaceae bacterium]|nr:tetratricopeptide repeat protein [Planctomycetaceae bacterium]